MGSRAYHGPYLGSYRNYFEKYPRPQPKLPFTLPSFPWPTETSAGLPANSHVDSMRAVWAVTSIQAVFNIVNPCEHQLQYCI